MMELMAARHLFEEDVMHISRNVHNSKIHIPHSSLKEVI